MWFAKIMKQNWWRERIYREEWNIGMVDQSAEEIVRRGIVRPVRWFPSEKAAMRADPCCLRLEDNRLLILTERMDYKTARGEIWFGLLPPDGDPQDAVFRQCLSAAVHLSYPFAFADDYGRSCLTVESAEANNLFLWRRDGDEWTPSGPILPGLAAIDATLWRGGDRWWLFCGLLNDLPNERLHVFYADQPEGPWSPHPANPVKSDSTSSRPAGPLFLADGMIIRPAQDCSQTYGGAVTLNAIVRLDLDGFHETPVRRLEPFDQLYPHGFHSFCSAGAVTLIDGKRLQLLPLELLARPMRKLKSAIRRRSAQRSLQQCWDLSLSLHP